MRRHATTLLTAGLCALSLGCGAGAFVDGVGDIDFCGKVTRVSFDSAALTLRIGEEATVHATGFNRAGVAGLCDTRYATTNSAVASVSSDGRVTGVGPGSAWIRGTIKGITDSMRVTMSTATLVSLVLEPLESPLLVGQTHRFAVTGRDSAGNVLVVRRVSWSANPSSVLAITPRGTVTARNAGNATVTAAAEGHTVTAPVAPVRAAPTVTFSRISAGAEHTCALVGGAGIAIGSAWCWGNGIAGQLGNGDNLPREFPVAVAGARSYVDIAAGGDHTCATTGAGEVWCWGANRYGQLGTANTTPQLAPVRAATSVALHGIAAATGASCGLAADSTAYCWGTWGTAHALAPTALSGGLRFSRLSAGGGMICGLSGAGQVHCWGSFNERSYAAPTLVSGNVSFRTIDVGFIELCGVSMERALYCWGHNTGFWSGDVAWRATPSPIGGGISVDSVATSNGFTCAISAPSALSCLGTLTTEATAIPFSIVPVSRGTAPQFVSLTAGDRQGCAIDTLGGAWCWGGNDALQVGVGQDIYTGLPLQLRIR